MTLLTDGGTAEMDGKRDPDNPLQDEFHLETIGQLHAVAANLFIPFSIVRLQDHPQTTSTTLTVELRGIRGRTTEERQLRLTWDAKAIPALPLAIQENPLTEWAALGVACVVIWQYAGVRLHEVAVQGDRFDYWVNLYDQQYGLEVSGTVGNDLEARHREKVRQLLDNPYQCDGYVVAVDFASRRVIFSFQRFSRRSNNDRPADQRN